MGVGTGSPAESCCHLLEGPGVLLLSGRSSTGQTWVLWEVRTPAGAVSCVIGASWQKVPVCLNCPCLVSPVPSCRMA